MHDPTANLLISALDRGTEGDEPAALAEAARIFAARIADIPGVRISASPYVTYLAATGPQRSDPPLAASA